MDPFLVDYLRSGKAWLLVGSGPSSAMGYPSWGALAASSVALARSEGVGRDMTRLDAAARMTDYPATMEEAAAIVGLPRLIQHLRGTLRPSAASRVYEYLARWPVPVYLTTNYDHEILAHLAGLGEAYVEYTNSEEHSSLLLPDFQGAIVQLHGDLRSQTGLILTSSQYRAIGEGADWTYWRTKLTSIFQMNRVVVVGYSLTDPHIRHVLAAAKQGAGVVQPVCWIAPDVAPNTVREYLEKYRIRVITYDNRDGTHRNLVRLIEHITDFVPPRVAVRLSQSVARVSESPLGTQAAAPGFFVFSKLSGQANFEQKRLDVAVAAIRAAAQQLPATFSLHAALILAGWPTTLPLTPAFAAQVADRAVADGLLLRAAGDIFSLAPAALGAAQQERARFDHLRNRFHQSLRQRLGSKFPNLGADQIEQIASDIEAALTGYFREGGLTLASTLSTAAAGPPPTVPSSVVRFMNDASTRYADHLSRQAFSTVSLDTFVRADAAEREFLGRVSQGFFAFHMLGVFGDAAAERLRHARETVWLVDSSAQIPAVALGAPAHTAFRDAFAAVRELGIRLFTTERLFDETREHLWFANRVVDDNGPTSPLVIAGAKGHAPYRKANLFLEGFIAWQAAGNPGDWHRYLFAVGGHHDAHEPTAREAVTRARIEIVPFGDWPGFQDGDYAEASSVTETVVETYGNRPAGAIYEPDLYQKAQPEAEALVVVENERSGKYHMLSDPGVASPAWFLSETSVLNAVHAGHRITWQPEAFIRFAATLSPTTDQEAADRAFETLLWSLAQVGVSVLDDRLIVGVFGGVIDQARLSVAEQHAEYDTVLGQKYGEPIDSVLARVPDIQKPLAALQLANELAVKEASLRAHAEAIAVEAVKRAKSVETQLRDVERFKRKQEEKRRRAKKNARRAKSSKRRR